MIEAVFISDLHLHPEESAITQRFNLFIDWAIKNTKSVYILGDFFHVWPGDDALDDWNLSIARRLSLLAEHDIAVYFIRGNRDFLLGQEFAKHAQIKMLEEPAIITLGQKQILLVHGDRYCTKDRGHQLLRLLTRNPLFPAFFLKLPWKIRSKIVRKMRQTSQRNRGKSEYMLQIVPSAMLKHMQQLKADTIIHGHIHRPGSHDHETQDKILQQYVLSDWDDNPLLLCYHKSSGFYFDLLVED
ncbi:UDP-2,3-diacylglucosamine diphosphatase [Legionella londiniensis]|uniref:UDP-2,3-diacylglucosamine hydrolase n=1 Tax=Legionella londiniensis TaxID=45068 RepID=A0A0W0VMC5_9GAMM|nr:UDP-2,3-diacylglucosamine diphosphatase [Legionella londiniensis]KTD21301.1 UDP-2,3-diacylglucosamine hydrolase [Legionella londiniensis]STX93327.1 UDP-2,3-diacylglucosamine hydrolase [Legionella londiniensis]